MHQPTTQRHMWCRYGIHSRICELWIFPWSNIFPFPYTTFYVACVRIALNNMWRTALDPVPTVISAISCLGWKLKQQAVKLSSKIHLRFKIHQVMLWAAFSHTPVRNSYTDCSQILTRYTRFYFSSVNFVITFQGSSESRYFDSLKHLQLFSGDMSGCILR